MNFICAYAPTEDKDAMTKDQFYKQVELVYDGLPKADVIILLGDLNAKNS